MSFRPTIINEAGRAFVDRSGAVSFGGFMVMWAIIVIASGFYGRRIKYSL